MGKPNPLGLILTLARIVCRFELVIHRTAFEKRMRKFAEGCAVTYPHPSIVILYFVLF